MELELRLWFLDKMLFLKFSPKRTTKKIYMDRKLSGSWTVAK
jgi:hypothetical protein